MAGQQGQRRGGRALHHMQGQAAEPRLCIHGGGWLLTKACDPDAVVGLQLVGDAQGSRSQGQGGQGRRRGQHGLALSGGVQAAPDHAQAHHQECYQGAQGHQARQGGQGDNGGQHGADEAADEGGHHGHLGARVDARQHGRQDVEAAQDHKGAAAGGREGKGGRGGESVGLLCSVRQQAGVRGQLATLCMPGCVGRHAHALVAAAAASRRAPQGVLDSHDGVGDGQQGANGHHVLRPLVAHSAEGHGKGCAGVNLRGTRGWGWSVNSAAYPWSNSSRAAAAAPPAPTHSPGCRAPCR